MSAAAKKNYLCPGCKCIPLSSCPGPGASITVEAIYTPGPAELALYAYNSTHPPIFGGGGCEAPATITVEYDIPFIECNLSYENLPPYSPPPGDCPELWAAAHFIGDDPDSHSHWVRYNHATGLWHWGQVAFHANDDDNEMAFFYDGDGNEPTSCAGASSCGSGFATDDVITRSDTPTGLTYQRQVYNDDPCEGVSGSISGTSGLVYTVNINITLNDPDPCPEPS